MIITDEKILRTPGTNAASEDVRTIIEALERELEHSGRMGKPGIGLAANQIGIHKNVAIIRIDHNHSANLVNCKIAHQYDPFVFREEGCLSIPDKLVNTTRYNEIHIVDNLVYPHSFIATGIFAVAIQHELDHLQGRLITDIAIQEKSSKKQKPNELCACGSGKKFKRCCAI